MYKLTYLCICAFSVLTLLPSGSGAQIITTVAGGGMGGDGMPATAASLAYPTYVTLDNSGNLYIVDAPANKIRKVNTSGIISTFAGTGTPGNSGDGGPAAAAEIDNGVYADQTGGVAAASGNVYIVDSWNNVIRMVNASGTISWIAGTGTAGYGGDGGAATAAMIDTATGVCVDGGGNIYIADSKNNRIRKINASGIMSTFAGNGTPGYSGDGGNATAAELSYPADVKADASGNIYIADWNNARIRRVNASGMISTVATGVIGGLAIDGVGNVFVASLTAVHKIDISAGGAITTIAGIVDSNGFSGDGGRATAAKLSEVWDAAFDAAGNLYIADAANGRIRMVAHAGAPAPSGIPQFGPATGNTISILPNPNKGIFNVTCSLNTQTNENAAVQVIAMCGQVVFTTTVAVQKGDVNAAIQPVDIPSGTYLLNIKCGAQAATVRFVVVN